MLSVHKATSNAKHLYYLATAMVSASGWEAFRQTISDKEQ